MNIITITLDWLYKIFYGLNALDLIITALLIGIACYACYRQGLKDGKQAPRRRLPNSYIDFKRNH